MLCLCTQNVGFDLTHVDAVGSVADPPILAATIISSLLLIVASILWVRLWFRPARSLFLKSGFLVLVGAVLYVFAAFFQIRIGTAFYRYAAHLDPTVTLGLWVPVAPVWWSGALSAAAYLILRRLRRAGLQRT